MAYTYPAAPIGAVFHYIVNYTMMAQQLMTNLHFRLEGNTNQRTINVVCDAINTLMLSAGNFIPLVRGVLEPDQVITTTSCQMIHPTRFVGVGYNINQAGTLPQVESLNITQCAASLTLRSVEATRRGLATLKIPIAVQTQNIGNGIPTVQLAGIIGQIGNAILNAKNFGDGITMVPVIYHRNFVPVTSVIESFKVAQTLRTVRRRTVGVGI